ncbi:hypothetical protein HEFE104084_07165 [Helicobacter felis]|uniref:Uncharacterized protein n=1 Tax=Helicobacter felis (strain ATCC 49179 / CCUG 28539 / NCTC 12436 / CS1) TaxID=936155 RepID=E7ACZ8_HELFC|nr:putative uncharacterized protein [Helicobacter felis ATCC 49179]
MGEFLDYMCTKQRLQKVLHLQLEPPSATPQPLRPSVQKLIITTQNPLFYGPHGG